VIHSTFDDGLPPYGNAGGPQAYGLIGLGKPDTAAGTNEALAPSLPTVDKLICTFEAPLPGQTASYQVEGSVLLTLQQPYRPDVVRMQALLTGLTGEAKKSFHFHTWGDLTAGLTIDDIGGIYKSHQIDPEALSVNNKGEAQLDVEYKSDSLLEHVGRALTIHSGPTAASDTIAAAVCGIASPTAAIATGQSYKSRQGTDDDSSAMSSWAMAIMVIAIIAVASAAGLGLLYYLRLPIPCCANFFYPNGRDNYIKTDIPPPPPRGPQTHQVSAVPTQEPQQDLKTDSV